MIKAVSVSDQLYDVRVLAKFSRHRLLALKKSCYNYQPESWVSYDDLKRQVTVLKKYTEEEFLLYTRWKTFKQNIYNIKQAIAMADS